jgi:hypothetical protein
VDRAFVNNAEFKINVWWRDGNWQPFIGQSVNPTRQPVKMGHDFVYVRSDRSALTCINRAIETIAVRYWHLADNPTAGVLSALRGKADIARTCGYVRK